MGGDTPLADKTRQTVFDSLTGSLIVILHYGALFYCLLILLYLCALLSSSLVVLLSCCLLLLLFCCLVVFFFCCLVVLLSCCLVVLLLSSLVVLFWEKLKVTFQFSSLRGIFNGFEQDQWDSSSITTVKQVKLETSITRQHLKIYFKDWG